MFVSFFVYLRPVYESQETSAVFDIWKKMQIYIEILSRIVS